MRVVKPSRIMEYAARFPGATKSLMAWLKITRKANWKNFAELRRVYPHADSMIVGSGNEVTGFNVCGNRYRLIVAINYHWGMVYVLRFLTHKQYDVVGWKDQL